MWVGGSKLMEYSCKSIGPFPRPGVRRGAVQTLPSPSPRLSYLKLLLFDIRDKQLRNEAWEICWLINTESKTECNRVKVGKGSIHLILLCYFYLTSPSIWTPLTLTAFYGPSEHRTSDSHCNLHLMDHSISSSLSLID